MSMGAHSTDPPQGRWGDEPRNGYHDMSESVHTASESERRRRERTAFEIHNVSGKPARGIEIELAGFGEEDVFHAYYLNRYGAPAVTRTPHLIRMRFENLWRATAETVSQVSVAHAGTSTTVSRPFIWELALYGGGGCERFRLEMSTCDVIATYRWLVAADTSGDQLVADSTPAFVHDARTHTRRNAAGEPIGSSANYPVSEAPVVDSSVF